MDLVTTRLRSHRLSAPSRTIAAASTHMLAVQAQEFTGGRWALGVRTRSAPTLRDVDRAFERGEIVRSWTQRGTIHIVPARDLPWMLSVTGDRQARAAAAAHRREGIDEAEYSRAGRLAASALAGGGRLTRAELFAVLEAGGVSTAGQRGYHLLTALAIRGIVCLGPVVPRESGPSREQYVVRADEWITDAAEPADPLAEMFARYIDGHAPATARDFAWWSGLPVTLAREAAERAGDRVRIVAADPEAVYLPASAPPRRSASAAEVLALAPFEEFYLSYADRSSVCAPEYLDVIGPSKNGMVRAILLARGVVAGVWTHSLAVGRHDDQPVPELFEPGAASDAEIAAALTRYRDFILG